MFGTWKELILFIIFCKRDTSKNIYKYVLEIIYYVFNIFLNSLLSERNKIFYNYKLNWGWV